ncbi:MAG: tetratricopeptide repeat protein [Pseudoxanthomonas sp.]|nr:tetratricopeptide repeat protein [Pseudoxanthomonas sp.]
MRPDESTPAGGDGTARYRFDGIVVDAAARTLVRDGQAQALEPKAFAVLLALLQRPGELLGRDALLDLVWGHRHVTPGVLTRVIAQLRAALDDDSHHPRYIQTRHALGYCFIGTLEAEPRPAVAAPAAVPAAPAPVEEPAAPAEDAAAPVAVAALPASPPAPSTPSQEAAPRHSRRAWASGLVFAVLLAAIAWAWRDRPPSATPLEASIAVLPFTTLSDVREDRYFAEGLSVEMLNALAGVPGLKVAAWRPPEAIDRGEGVQALGRLLGVATVLDASVRRDGGRLRISARLSDATTGFTLWSRNYEGDADAVFDTQTDIANAVTDALLDVLPEEREALQRRLMPTRDASAFGSYLLGVGEMLHSEGASGREEAARHFRSALSTDAGFARAQAALCRMELWNFLANHNADAFDKARLACLRAQNMDRTLGDVNVALGDLYRVQDNEKQALYYYDLAINDPVTRWEALDGRAWLHVNKGRETEAMNDFHEALKASPGNARVHADLGYQQFRLGHYRDAIDSYRTAVSLRPDDADYWNTYGGLLLAAGDNEAAEAAMRRSLAIEPREGVLSNLGTLRYQKGDYAGAAGYYRRAARLNPTDFSYPGNLGDALDADPGTAAQARQAYAQAADLAQRYLDANPGDAKAQAALGWYRAQLGDADTALRLAGQARALDIEPGEVALYNALTYAGLGRLDQARAALESARDTGIPASRIDTHAVFRRAGLVESPGTVAPAPAESPASAAHPPGA